MEKRRIIPTIFVLCVIFATVLCPGVAAAGMSGLEITGQTAMTQQTFTNLSVIGADSCGLTDAINSSKNPAQSIGEWMKDGWDTWLLQQQLTWGTVLNIAAAGARYTGNGDLLFNSQLSDLFTRYYNWLWDGEGGPNIKENAEVVPGEEPGSLNVTSEIKAHLKHPNYQYDLSVTQGVIGYKDLGGSISTFEANTSRYAVCALRNTSFCEFDFVSDEPFTVKMYYDGNPSNTYNSVASSYNGLTFYVVRGPTFRTSYQLIGCSAGRVLNQNGSIVENFDLWDLAYIIYAGGVNIGGDQVLGDPDRLGGLDGADTNILAPPDLINIPDFSGNSGYLDINDYIGGIKDAIESEDGTADINITDSAGVESTGTMELDQATDIPVSQEATADLVNQGTVISTATPSTELAEYTIDLRSYFPFCIPWDLYDMITLLVADPVAPHVQYPFVIAPLNVNYTIDLDFSTFDSVAAVLRNMELLAAGIGLALMTKKLIQGGD